VKVATTKKFTDNNFITIDTNLKYIFYFKDFRMNNGNSIDEINVCIPVVSAIVERIKN
jgi:flagellar motor switch protein FliM